MVTHYDSFPSRPFAKCYHNTFKQDPSHVQISVHAIGLNFADVFAVLGLYSAAGNPPFTPGFELSGVVQAVGDDVTEFQVGDRVFALTRFGAYSTVLQIHRDYVYPLHHDWTFAEGAAWPCQALTAWYALCVLGGLNKGACRLLTSAQKRVIVHSAAGGVGLALVELIRHIGGDVIATIGDASKASILLKRGVPASRIVVRNGDDADAFEKTVRQILKEQQHQGEEQHGTNGVDVVIDPIMGPYFQAGWKLLNRGGRYIVMGSASLMPSTALVGFRNFKSLTTLVWRYLRRPKLDLIAAIDQNKTVSAFNLGRLFDCSELVKIGFDELSQVDIRKPFIGRTFAFDDVHEALRTFQSGTTVGKIVLLVDGSKRRHTTLS